MSRYNYVITIKEPDYKRIDAITFLMLVLAIAFFVYVIVHQWSSALYHNAAILYVVIVSFIVFWSAYRLLATRNNHEIAYYRLALFVAAIGWFTQPVENYWMAGLFLIAALLEKQVKFSQEIGVDESGITFNTLPQKEYEWKEIKNLLLKEGILTVDYKNNKLFQHEIESEVSPMLEREFNQYCQANLSMVKVDKL